jgi:hypothetical protein
MAITYGLEDPTVRAVQVPPIHMTAESVRLLERAALRSCTRSLLRRLDHRLDQTVDSAARGRLSRQMRDLRDELVAALRGDPAAIASLSAMRHPRVP